MYNNGERLIHVTRQTTGKWLSPTTTVVVEAVSNVSVAKDWVERGDEQVRPIFIETRYRSIDYSVPSITVVIQGLIGFVIHIVRLILSVFIFFLTLSSFLALSAPEMRLSLFSDTVLQKLLFLLSQPSVWFVSLTHIKLRSARSSL